LGFAFRPWVGQFDDLLYFRHDNDVNLTLGYNQNGSIWVKNANGTVVGWTTEGLIRFRRWNYIEIKATFHDSTGSAVVQFNGKEVINVTNQDFANVGGHNHSNNLEFDYHLAQLMDDMYLIDPDTSGLSDFLGPVVIRRLQPASDTATKDFTPSAGTDHFDCVNNDRADETDYLTSGTINDDELWNYDDVPSEVSDIKAINIETAVAATGSEPKQAASLCKSGASPVGEMGTLTTIETTWDQVNDIVENNPNTSSPWTPATLDAATFGVRHKA
jgi:hypothetical protein